MIEQEAAARKVQASDAEVDSQIEKIKEDRLGKDDAKDNAKWSTFLAQTNGMSPNEFRQNVAKQMLGPALVNSYKNDFTITEAEAKNQSSEVKLQLLLVGTKSQFSGMMGKKGPQPLDDAPAKAKADDLLAKAKAGADMNALVKANSTDFTASQGGIVPFAPEYAIGQGSDSALNKGKEFDAAVHKAATGGVYRSRENRRFMPGYAFAKVLERRNNLPKDFNATKVIESLKQKRAEEKANEIIGDRARTAKIEIKDPKIQTYYDYFRLKQSEQAQMQAMTGQETAKKLVLPPAEVTKLETSTQAGFEAMLKTDPNDITAAQILAEALKKKKATDPASRDRLIALEETILKGTENQQTRVELAKLYQDKHDLAKAKEQYDQIAKIQGRKPVYNTETATEAKNTYTLLATSYRGLGDADATTKMNAKLEEVKKKELDYKLQDLKNQQSQKGLPPGAMPGGIQMPTPTPGGTPPPAPARK